MEGRPTGKRGLRILRPAGIVEPTPARRFFLFCLVCLPVRSASDDIHSRFELASPFAGRVRACACVDAASLVRLFVAVVREEKKKTMIKRRSKYARLCLVCKARQAKQQKVKRARSRLNEQRKQVSAGTYFWSNQDLSRRRVVPRYATCVWVVGSSFFLSFFPSYRRHINYLHCIALHLRCLALLLLSPIISLPLSFSLTLSLSLTHSLSLSLTLTLCLAPLSYRSLQTLVEIYTVCLSFSTDTKPCACLHFA